MLGIFGGEEKGRNRKRLWREGKIDRVSGGECQNVLDDRDLDDAGLRLKHS